MTAAIEARGLKKSFGSKEVLHGLDLSIPAGRIVGLIGPNGAGKSTAVKAILGLTPVSGTLQVLGLDPFRQRDQLMQQVCFIADVAVLPRWIRVEQLIEYTRGVHPRFSEARCKEFLSHTKISPRHRVRELSKGMVVQLHLALVMAIDARLLVLDEPTLGLDILYRKAFYESLLNDYFDEQKTILITTHQVEEVEHLLTDLVFIQNGAIVLDSTMDEIAERYTELMVRPEHLAAARALNPLHERAVFGRSVLLYDGVDRTRLAELGELHNPSIADLFVATMKGDMQ